MSIAIVVTGVGIASQDLDARTRSTMITPTQYVVPSNIDIQCMRALLVN